MNAIERLGALVDATKGIELTGDIDELLEDLASESSPEDIAILCDLFGRLRRGAMPVIDIAGALEIVHCGRSGRNFVGDNVEQARCAHDRFCPVCETKEQTA